jgi:hypothetical protein
VDKYKNKKREIMSINEHKDYTKPYWVAKYEDNSVIKYGEISEGSILNTKMDIYTFSEKEDMINFIERNGGEYINQELNKSIL